MRVLVTGAAGMLGSAAVRALAVAGHEVLGTDLRTPKQRECEFRVADLLSAPAVSELVEGVEAVVHLGNHPNLGRRPPQRVYGENCVMNANVFHAALERKVAAVVFASSVQVVATGGEAEGGRWKPPYLPFDSRMPLSLGNSYAASKAAAEQLLGLIVGQGVASGVAVRFPFLVRPEHVLRFRACASEARQRPALGDVLYLVLEDAAAFLVALVGSRLPGFRTMLPAWPDPLLAMTSEEARVEFFPDVPVKNGALPLRHIVDLSEPAEAGGWAPGVSFADVLAR